MFKGEYNHTMDVKGRVIIPAKFRETLGDSFTITKGFEKCLYGFTDEDWKAFEDSLADLPITNVDARKIARFFSTGACDCEIDKQGRTLLPPVLREYAGLEKDIVLVGVSRHFEIWSKDNWLEVTAEFDGNMDAVAANIEKLGFSI